MVARPPRFEGGLTLRLVGEFAVLTSGRPLPAPQVGSRKARTLLKRLAVERDGWVQLDQIVDALWGVDAPRQPGDNVATLVSRLRASLGDGIIDGGRDGYRLGRPPGVDVDVAIAARDVAYARQRLSSGEYALAAAAAGRALAMLADGRALPAETDAAWADSVRALAAGLLRDARTVAAESALAVHDPATARGLAVAAIDSDPFDEPAYRIAMRAEVANGAPSRALAIYERLRTVLADELGTDPAPESRTLHRAILREEPLPRKANAPVSSGRRPVLAGRGGPIDVASRRWAAAAAGAPSLLLVTGEAGIGKTTFAAALADIASDSGGTVLRARCYEAERSLFLQPMVDALGEHASTANPAAIRSAAGEWAGPVAALVPQIAAMLEPLPAQRDRGNIARRRSYDAFTRYVCRLASSPVLLLLDDLQHAGIATVELLHYLVRQARDARLLVVGTVRTEEGAAVLTSLAEVSHRIELDRLSRPAVAELAAAAGHAELADRISTRTGGHTLFVVESLRALAIGDSSIPESLHAAVLSRVARTGEQTAHLLRAASVLGAAIEPDMLARMLDMSPIVATERCEQAMIAYLLVVADRAFEFANDLIREVLYESIPIPTRIALHRRAADLLGDRPEAVGAHASAAGDWSRAARAWLVAGEQAYARIAYADADALLTRAIEASVPAGEREVAGRAHLARGKVRDATAAYSEAVADLEAAADIARQVGDRRLEMLSLRELAGDVMVARGTPANQWIARLHEGLTIAEALGDRAMESEMLCRLSVVATNQLQVTDALAYGHRALTAARTSGDAHTLVPALDCLKTAYAYLGEIDSLMPILAELEPLVRLTDDVYRMPWVVQESAFPAIAASRWDEAIARLTQALELNRRSGYTAYEGWFVGHIAWVHRLSGDIDNALTLSRRAVDLTQHDEHAWWSASTHTQLGMALLATGDRDGAIEQLERGRAYVDHDGSEARLMNCLGPLAEATGARSVLAEADQLLDTVRVPEGSAWMLGAEAYLAIARAWLAHGEPARARATVEPLRRAALRTGWGWVADAAAAVIESSDAVAGGGAAAAAEGNAPADSAAAG